MNFPDPNCQNVDGGYRIDRIGATDRKFETEPKPPIATEQLDCNRDSNLENVMKTRVATFAILLGCATWVMAQRGSAPAGAAPPPPTGTVGQGSTPAVNPPTGGTPQSPTGAQPPTGATAQSPAGAQQSPSSSSPSQQPPASPQTTPQSPGAGNSTPQNTPGTNSTGAGSAPCVSSGATPGAAGNPSANPPSSSNSGTANQNSPNQSPNNQGSPSGNATQGNMQGTSAAPSGNNCPPGMVPAGSPH